MIEFKYKTYGDKNTKPLLLLHGFMGESADYDSLASKLQNTFYCIVIDLPGHGQTKSSDDADYTIEKTSDAVIGLLQKLQINKPHLYGYSMGGRIAFYLLTHYPNVFDKSIIESSSPGLKTEDEKKERKQKDLLLVKRMRMQSLKLFLQDWYNLELFSTIDKQSESFQTMLTQKSKNNIAKLALSLQYAGTGVMPSLWDMLESIQTDVLLITGAFDNKYKNIAQEITTKHSNFTHQIIDDASHNVHFEYEDKCCEKIRDFMS